jgi:hypothetical protein
MAVTPNAAATVICQHLANERDGLDDDLPPDYATRVGEGWFYG